MRFFSVPAWKLLAPAQVVGDAPKEEGELNPALADPSLVKAALTRVEYRGWKALERADELMAAKTPAVFASAPGDLPALLRTADQLLTFARMDGGEHIQVWRCTCGTPWAVPVALVRPVSVHCQRCGNTLELDPPTTPRETTPADEKTAALNATRRALADFFREAMARGWPVLVARS